MNFSFYMVDAAYCDYLRESDPCVPYTMERKSIRPFVGIVFSVHNVHYYAPLTSPKPKHLHMKNQVDFLKINGGEWGAINFNNMIPVHPGSLTKVEMKIFETDSPQDIAYKNLLSNQLSQFPPGHDFKSGGKALPPGRGWKGVEYTCQPLLQLCFGRNFMCILCQRKFCG